MEVSKDFKTVRILLSEEETLGLFTELLSLVLKIEKDDIKNFQEKYRFVDDLSNKLGALH